MEEYKVHPIYNELLISDYGNVLIPKQKTGRNAHITNGCKNGKGYLFIQYKGKCLRVHRLVAQTFQDICGEWFESCVVDHINGIKTDNRAINLRVCTTKENCNNPVTKQKLINNITSKPHIKSYKQVYQYDKDYNLVNVYDSVKSTKEFGYDVSCVANCCRGIQKTHKGYIWSYKELNVQVD